LPPKLEEIISKALEKDSKLRYQHASEVAADLRRLKREMDSGRAVLRAARPRKTVVYVPCVSTSKVRNG
jgi:hypothetical protein